MTERSTRRSARPSSVSSGPATCSWFQKWSPGLVPMIWTPRARFFLPYYPETSSTESWLDYAPSTSTPIFTLWSSRRLFEVVFGTLALSSEGWELLSEHWMRPSKSETRRPTHLESAFKEVLSESSSFTRDANSWSDFGRFASS
jgi:hypothetical protein